MVDANFTRSSMTAINLPGPLFWLHVRDVYGNVPLRARNHRDKGSCVAQDIKQGRVGDCWLLAALASIVSSLPDFFEHRILEERDGSFWVFLGKEWEHVDGFLPFTLVPHGGLEPVGTLGTELWPSIVEKAVVKKFQSPHLKCDEAYSYARAKRLSRRLSLRGPQYLDVHGGLPKWGIQILLGVAEFPGLRLETALMSDSVLKSVLLPHNAVSIVCLCTSTQHKDDTVQDGFVYGHAYGTLGTTTADGDFYVRVYNPWGSYESVAVSEQRLDGTTVDDGAFYVSLSTLRDKFPTLAVVFVAV